MITKKSPAELTADMLDVHVLDMLVQIEALLRGAREVQRGILRVRGVIDSPTNKERDGAAHAVRERLDHMLVDCDSTREAVKEACNTAKGLKGFR